MKNPHFARVPILQAFREKDWPRFQRFWLRGIWKYLPFAIVSRDRLLNMHWDVADHAVSYTANEAVKISKAQSEKDSTGGTTGARCPAG